MKIKFFAIGGTIDKVYFDALSNYQVGPPGIESIIREARVNFDYEVVSLLKKDSLDMTPEDRKLIHDAVTKENSKHIVITHGTDTMVDTFYIQEVFIDTNMRGRKLGKILIEYALLLCPVNKKYMSLMTYEGNIMAKIATDKGFVLQKKPSVCPVNRLLLIRTMNEEDFNKNTNRITASAT